MTTTECVDLSAVEPTHRMEPPLGAILVVVVIGALVIVVLDAMRWACCGGSLATNTAPTSQPHAAVG